MDVIDSETGLPFELRLTDEVEREMRLLERRCQHTQLEVRQATVGNGAIHLRKQCQQCGLLVGNALPKTTTSSSVLPEDEELRLRWERQHKLDLEALLQRFVKKQKAEDEVWRKDYNKYLTSPEWQRRREKVLKRAKGICEGCGEKPAKQVHHLTYKHVCAEFLFELVAICDECHDRIHLKHSSDLDELETICNACRWQSSEDHTEWCAKFEIASANALAPLGPCGPDHIGLEPLR